MDLYLWKKKFRLTKVEILYKSIYLSMVITVYSYLGFPFLFLFYAD